MPFRVFLTHVGAVMCFVAFQGGLWGQSLPESLNNPGKAFTPSARPFSPNGWTVTNAITHDGVAAARSGVTAHNQNSTLETTFTGPGTLRFWWKVSCESGNDKLYLFVDGAVQAQISGEQNWAQYSVALGAGVHAVEWAYAKNGSVSSGQDAGWVDEVAFIPPAGDAALHIDARLRAASITRSTLVYTEPDSGLASFRGRALIDFQQLDETTAPPGQTTVPVRVTWTAEQAGTGVPVAAGDYDTTVTIPTHTGGAQPLAGTALLQADFTFTAGANLGVDPLTPHRLRVTARHTEPGGAVHDAGGEALSAPSPLLTLSGRLTAGGVEARFSEMGWSPAVTVSEPPGHRLEVDSAPGAVSLLSDGAIQFRLQGNTVYRDPNSGDLDLRPGLAASLPDFTRTVQGVRTRAKGVTLSANGLRAGEYRIHFPAGFSVMVPPVPDPDFVMEKTSSGCAVESDVALSPDLAPAAPVSLTPLGVRRGAVPDAVDSYGLLFCFHERLPCWYVADTLTYDPATGSFTPTPAGDPPWRYVREEEKFLFAGIAQHPPATPGAPHDTRPSNDGFCYRASAAGEVPMQSFVVTTTQEGVARLTARCTFAGGTHEPHWPQGASASFSHGSITFQDGELVPAASALEGVSALTQRYARDGAETKACGTAAGEGNFTFAPAGQRLFLMPDGGTQAVGTLPMGDRLRWGTVDQLGPGGAHRFAHATDAPFTVASFYQPGYFLSGQLTARSDDDRPGTLLLTGRSAPDAPATVERPVPGDPGYFTTGAADYAGLNLRVAREPGADMDGVSTLAGQPFGPYPLSAASRYSVHRGGVCGVHERLTTPGSIPVDLFGFACTLTYFKLGWLDNANESSVCDGGLSVPYPSQFTQSFESLRFNLRGQPGPAALPTNPPARSLAYWGGQVFEPLAISFQPTFADNACTQPPAGNGFVEMAARFPSLAGGFVPGPLQGTLGFKPTGHLITAEDRRSGLARGSTVDSRVTLPPQLTIVAPGGGSYSFQPLTRGSFNAYPGGGGDGGFLSFAGKLAVPFFEAMPVHLHVQPAQGGAGIHVMNGWEDGGRTFFNEGDRFDPMQRGAPPLVSVDDYRSPSTPAAEGLHLPRARKNWLAAIDFNYPLRWDPALRTFASPRPLTEDLLLFTLTHQCGQLSANGAEVKFGTEISALPDLNPQKLLLGALDGLPGNPLGRFDAALKVALGNAAEATRLTQATAALDTLLSDRLSEVMKPVAGAPAGFLSLEQRLQTRLDQLLPAVPAAGVSAGDFKQDLLATIAADPTALTQPMVEALGLNGLVTLAQWRLDQAKLGLELVRDLVRTPDGASRREAFRRLVRELAGTNAAVADAVLLLGAGNGLSWLDAELDRLELTPFLAELEATLTALVAQVTTLRSSLQSAVVTPAQSLLNAAFGDALRAAVAAELDHLLPDAAALLRPADSAELGRLRTRLRTVLVDGFFASSAARQITVLLRQNVNGPRATLRAALDSLLSQVRDSVKNAVVESGSQQLLGTLPAFEPLRGAEQLARSFGAANLRGYARTVGNSISTVRLDGSLKFSPPGLDAGVEATGYVEYKDHELLGPDPDCLQVGSDRSAAVAVAGGIRVGSTGKPRGSAPPGNLNSRGTSFDGMGVGADIAFALDANRLPVGFRGTLFFNGEANFGLVTVQKVELTANFSAQNQYLIGTADGQVLQILDVKAQMFAGNTCDFGRLGLLDAYTGRALDQLGYPQVNRQRMAGVVFKAQGGIALNEILPIPREVADIRLERGYTYLLLLTADAAGQPNFADPNLLLGFSEYGQAEVNLFTKLRVAGVELGYGAVAGVPADAGSLFNTTLAVNGGGRVCGPCLDLGIKKLCLPCLSFGVRGEVRPSPVPPFALFRLTGLDLDY